jgi:phenylpyruvate tautomerase PptA (4-oxalocrotonate tautomerase family)
MIDVHAPLGLLPAEKHLELGSRLTEALLKAEGPGVVEPFASNTGFFLNELPIGAVATAATPGAKVARVQVTTPPNALDRDGQRQLVADATAIIADVAGEPEQAFRTWVILVEAAEGGWGVAGTALGVEEFKALAGG